MSTVLAPALAANALPALSDAGEGLTITMLGGPMRLVAGPIHTTVRLIAGAAQTEGRFTFFEQTTPPGWEQPLHIHAHEDESVSILEGTYEFSIGGERRTLSPGGCANLPRGVAHSVRSVGSTAGRFLCLVTPGGLEEFYMELGRHKIPLTPNQLAEVARPYGLTLLPSGAPSR